MECIVCVKLLQIEKADVNSIIETVDGRTVETEIPDENDPVKLEQIRLKMGDKVDIPVSVFKRLGTSVKRYVPDIPTLKEIEALEALEALDTSKSV